MGPWPGSKQCEARMQLCSAYCVPRAPDGGPPKQHSAILKGQSEEEDGVYSLTAAGK